MHAAICVQSNQTRYEEARIALTLLRPLRQCHGVHLTLLQKGPDATMELYRSWANGEWWIDLYKTVSVLSSPLQLQEAGIHVEFGVKPDEAEALLLAFLRLM